MLASKETLAALVWYSTCGYLFLLRESLRDCMQSKWLDLLCCSLVSQATLAALVCFAGSTCRGYPFLL